MSVFKREIINGQANCSVTSIQPVRTQAPKADGRQIGRWVQ